MTTPSTMPSGMRSSSGTLIPFSAGRLNDSPSTGIGATIVTPKTARPRSRWPPSSVTTASAARNARIAAARVRHAEADEQHEQRGDPGAAACRVAARGVGRHPQRDRDREHHHEAERVPVLQRRAQARGERGVVEVDARGCSTPGMILPAERVERARERDDEPAVGEALDRARHARRQRRSRGRDERVGDRAVDVRPRALRRDGPQQRDAAPHREAARAGRRRSRPRPARAAAACASAASRPPRRRRRTRARSAGAAPRAARRRRARRRRRRRRPRARRGARRPIAACGRRGPEHAHARGDPRAGGGRDGHG